MPGCGAKWNFAPDRAIYCNQKMYFQKINFGKVFLWDGFLEQTESEESRIRI